VPEDQRLDEAQGRVAAPSGPKGRIDECIENAFQRLRESLAEDPRTLPGHAILPMGTPVATIVECAEVLAGSARDGGYPEELLPGDKELADRYRIWLAWLEPRVPSSTDVERPSLPD
jgi:hypothetical protein